MAFEILLQVNKSDNRQLDKDIDTILSLSGTLKAETSIIDPVILIECSMSDVRNCNYMTITSFGRKYFITNIRCVGTYLVEFSCHVDVLSTYATQIRANTAIIRKQENAWNLYLNDGSFKIYQNPNVLTKAFPSGFTTQEFVLAVAGS